MPRRYQADAIAIGINQEARFLHALSRNNQFSVAARRCGRQGLRVMVELDDGALRVVPVLFLPAANRQHMIEAKTDILHSSAVLIAASRSGFGPRTSSDRSSNSSARAGVS